MSGRLVMKLASRLAQPLLSPPLSPRVGRGQLWAHSG